MIIEKTQMHELQKKYGESFYLLDSSKFLSNYKELKKAFASIYPNFNIAYSYKTNYIPHLCNLVNRMGGYAEIVSEMELELAKRIGVEYKNIIWNGPVKNIDILQNFLLYGGIANVDSIEEFHVVEQIAKQNPDSNINIGIRCNYDVGDGVISRFGFDVHGKDFKYIINYIRADNNIVLKNFHCHFAKRQIEYWHNRTKDMLELVDELGIIPDRIDLGGGMFGNMPNELAKQLGGYIPGYSDYANVVAKPFAEYFSNTSVKPELVVEPGSALVGDCMQFVATVKSIKSIRGKIYATLSGSQKNISMTSVNPPIDIINMNDGEEFQSDLTMAGYTCIESDILYRGYNGKLSVGDVVVFGNCGSYSLVMKPPFILPNVPVIDVSNEEFKLIKRQETFDDVFQTFIF